MFNLDTLKEKFKSKAEISDEEARELIEDLNYPFNNEDLAKALGQLALDLGDEIDEYDTILSDDASGRPISLFLREVANKRREDDEDRIATYFLSAGQHKSIRLDIAIKNFLDNLEEEHDKKIGRSLVVTEHIASGHSLERLAQVLDRADIDFDVAALSIRGKARDHRKVGDGSHRMFFGKEDTKVGEFLTRQWGFSGVVKSPEHYDDPQLDIDPEGELEEKDVSAHPYKYPGADQEDINRAREDISKLADRVYELSREKEGA